MRIIGTLLLAAASLSCSAHALPVTLLSVKGAVATYQVSVAQADAMETAAGADGWALNTAHTQATNDGVVIGYAYANNVLTITVLHLPFYMQNWMIWREVAKWAQNAPQQ